MSMNKFIICTNAKRSQIENTETHYKIKGIPITINGGVMNETLYSKEENAKGMPSIIGKPFTIDHPADDNGNFVSALEGNGLMDYFSGGVVTNAYELDDVWYADAEIKKSLLAAQNNGQSLIDKLEGKSDLGVSTGLYFENNKISGTNAKGDKYSRVAMGQNFNHLAAVDNPAGGKETTAVFNSDNTFVCNFEDIKPAGPQNELIENDNFIDKLANKLKGLFANDNQTGYNNTDLNTNHEAPIMDRTEMLEALGLATNSQVTDDELKTLLKTKLAANASEVLDESTVTSIVEQAVDAAVKPLQDQLAANADKELNGLVADVVALKINGIDEAVAKTMGVDALKGLLHANSAEYVADYAAPRGRVSQINSAELLDSDMPE